MVAREIIRVEPLSTYLERWRAPTSAVTRTGDTVYVSGLPPFDPDTGEVADVPVYELVPMILKFWRYASCSYSLKKKFGPRSRAVHRRGSR